MNDNLQRDLTDKLCQIVPPILYEALRQYQRGEFAEARILRGALNGPLSGVLEAVEAELAKQVAK